MVGMRQPIKDFFWNNPTGWGSTFQAHPVALACGYACLKHFVETDILGHINKNIQPVMISELNRLVEKYACVRQARAAGAFGCLDLQDPKTGERPPQVHCAPPLIISEAELLDGFARLDRALGTLEA